MHQRSLNEKIPEMTFVNPNIPALTFGRDIKIEVVDTFEAYFKNYSPGLSYFRTWLSSRRNHAMDWGKSRPVNAMLVLW